MTNEIKEILDRFYDEYPKEIRILEKYITNLQEEKENAVECLKYYEEKHFIKLAIDNTKLTIELYNAYLKEINDLQKRIDKAVEYNKEIKNKIEKQLDNGQSYDFIVAGYLAIFHDTLEEILRGDE